MSTLLLTIVLATALLHASWNIIVKSGNNKLFETGLTATGGFLLGLSFLPFLPVPTAASWPFLCFSCLCHTTYYVFMARAYETTDISTAYTVMRGAAPLITSTFLLFFDMSLSLMGWIGIGFLCTGIFCLAVDTKKGVSGWRGIKAALITAGIIAAYTLTDGLGARANADGASYACWLFVLKMLPMQTYLLWRHGESYLKYVLTRPCPGIVGGMACFLSYGIAVWAMTKAPIAMVAALRETSVIFGMLLAVLCLHEKFSLQRTMAVVLVAAGASLLKIS
ncbi:MAG: EamA family transporter [Desulfovibrio sp.]|nr:EamA family transporter [Desulfovibrio sp.]